MSEANNFNPLTSAGAPKQFERRNVVRAVRNEIVDMPTQLKAASNIAQNDYVPFWEIEYEALDVKWNDGNPYKVSFGSRLVDKNGATLDNTQRPFVNAKAFAGLGIIAYPDDPNYDEDAVIGNVFELVGVEFSVGKPAMVPTAVLGQDFQFGGEVRVVTPKGEQGATAVPAVISAAANAIELTTDAAQLSAIRTLLTGVSEEDALDTLRDNNAGQNLTVNGKGVLGLAINGKLIQELSSVS